ncbi:MAG: PAS domain S-box protein [Candidatus Acidiferrales bacterium]
MPHEAETSPKPRDASHWEKIERREHALWGYSFLILVVMAVGLAATSWATFRTQPERFEALPVGLVVLVVLFTAYVWRQRREIGELRGFLRGLQQGVSAPPSDAQIERLLEVVARSQRGFRELIDSLDPAIFNVSLDGEIKVVNKSFAALLDLPFNEIVQHSIGEFFSEPTPDMAEATMPQFLEKRSWSGVLRVRLRKSGEARYYDTVLQPIVSDGKVVAISGIAKDVTAQRASELRFTELFESLQEGVYFSTPEGTLLEANPALVRMLGYNRKEELMPRDTREFYEDAAARVWKLKELERAGVVRNHEVTLIRKDGKKIRCLDSCSAIRDGSGKVVRIQGTLVDITDRVEIERRLQQEQEFGRRVVECFPDMIVALDSEGKFTFVSPRSQEVIGLSPAELVGKNAGERAHPEDAPRLLAHLQNLISGKSRFERFEFRVRHADGSWRTARVSASPLMDADGRTIGVVASARDLTEEKQFEQQLLQAEKFASMGQMLAGVAHELNNPLTAILGVSDLLRERASDDAMRRQTELVHQQARRAAEIVQSLLAFSRRSAPGRSPVRIEELVQRTMQLHGSTLSKKKITVDFRPTENLPIVEGDANLLLHVFLNLVINAEQAISASRDHGRIQITAIRLDDKIVVTFDDDGPGIPADILHKIFDPFFTTKRPGGGTGLGLTISMAIIREHGGTLEAHSTPGRGASIKIVLPVAQSTRALTPNPEAAAPDRSRQVVAGLQGHSILVVDDEDSIRELVSEGLAARGMAVETVTTCEEALAMLSIRQFDVILCDYNLPGLSGEQLFTRLCARPGGGPERFVFMTGDLLDSTAMDSFGQRGARALQKPFHLSGLASLLTEVLDAQTAKLS